MTEPDDERPLPGPAPVDPPLVPVGEDPGLPTDAPAPAGLATASRRMHAVRNELRKAVLGQEELIDQVLVGLLASGHVILEGVPGLGKTLVVLALARTFSGRFARIQFTPDLMPSDVTGHVMYDMESGRFHLRKGPAFTHLLLADEINRAPAKTQSALLEVMQERQITIEGESTVLEPPFMTFATQNPIEQEGTYPLPEAQLDRFLLKVVIEAPGEEDERAIVRHVTDGHTGGAFQLDAVRQVLTPAEVVEAQQLVTQVRVDDAVLAYAVRLVRATREARGLSLGAGPRGAIDLVRAARALALLEGRAYAVPDDVKRMALPTLRHRVALAPDLYLEGRGVDDALRAVIASVEAPRS